jgi:Putative lumazine-binding
MTRPAVEALMPAIRRYLDLMYDSDLSRFDQVFRSTAQLHGFQQGRMQMMTAAAFRDLMAGRPSPKSLDAPREEEILLVDFASSTQALAKVRVRINRTVFVDYLAYHLIDGEWLITAKGFHVEHVHPAAAEAAAG